MTPVPANVKLVLAPLAGFTNAAFRRLCHRRGADLTYTEMVSAAALAHGASPVRHLMETLPGEGPVVCQIFGANPDELAFAAAEVGRLGDRFQAVDLNAGCPMPNIVHEGAGARLLKDPEKLYHCLVAMKNATALPVTVKTRPGPSPDRVLMFELLDAAERAGCAGFTLHGRFTSQMHGGEVHYDLLAELVARARIPITGNGGVYNFLTARTMAETGVAAIMIGRAAMANPWLFADLRSERDPAELEDPVRRRMMQDAAFTEHLLSLQELRTQLAAHFPSDHVPDDDGFVSVALHTHLFRYFNGRVGAAAIRGRLNSIRTLKATAELSGPADVLVVGGGLAGWRAAQAAVRKGARVAMVCAGEGNSPQIHALNVPVLPEDSVERFVADTMSSGHGTNNPELVKTLCEQSPALAEEFQFDRDDSGAYSLLRPLGSSVPRCVTIAHLVGAKILAAIQTELRGMLAFVRGRVVSLEREGEFFAAKLEDGRCVEARRVVLATGGWCGRYAFSTNPPDLQGDGIVLAQALGAAVRDMDAVQYEPTVALAPESIRGIPVITTMMFEGAVLRNSLGQEFLPRNNLNKDEISKAMLAEIKAGRQVFFDATAVPRETLETKYADTLRRYAKAGMDITKEPMPVAPAPHTSLGGVVVDTSCRVLDKDGNPISGLFAAGEVTGGLHGLNRLGGNAGTEVLVFGRIAGEIAADFEAAKKNEIGACFLSENMR